MIPQYSIGGFFITIALQVNPPPKPLPLELELSAILDATSECAVEIDECTVLLISLFKLLHK